MAYVGHFFITKEKDSLADCELVDPEDPIVSVKINTQTKNDDGSVDKASYYVPYSITVDGKSFCFYKVGSSNVAYRSEDGEAVYRERYGDAIENATDDPDRLVRILNKVYGSGAARKIVREDEDGKIRVGIITPFYKKDQSVLTEAEIIHTILTLYEEDRRILLDAYVDGNIIKSNGQYYCVDVGNFFDLRIDEDNGVFIPRSPTSVNAWREGLREVYFADYQDMRRFPSVKSVLMALIALNDFFPDIVSVMWLEDKNQHELRKQLVDLAKGQVAPDEKCKAEILRKIEKAMGLIKSASPVSSPRTEHLTPGISNTATPTVVSTRDPSDSLLLNSGSPGTNISSVSPSNSSLLGSFSFFRKQPVFFALTFDELKKKLHNELDRYQRKTKNKEKKNHCILLLGDLKTLSPEAVREFKMQVMSLIGWNNIFEDSTVSSPAIDRSFFRTQSRFGLTLRKCVELIADFERSKPSDATSPLHSSIVMRPHFAS